jgi:hypothetical protein
MRRGYLKLAAAMKRRMDGMLLPLAITLVGHLVFSLGAIASVAYFFWQSR